MHAIVHLTSLVTYDWPKEILNRIILNEYDWISYVTAGPVKNYSNTSMLDRIEEGKNLLIPLCSERNYEVVRKQLTSYLSKRVSNLEKIILRFRNNQRNFVIIALD